MNHEFWNKMSKGMNEEFERFFKQRLLEILPEAMTRQETNMSEPIQQTLVMSGFNACLAEIRKRANL